MDVGGELPDLSERTAWIGTDLSLLLYAQELRCCGGSCALIPGSHRRDMSDDNRGTHSVTYSHCAVRRPFTA